MLTAAIDAGVQNVVVLSTDKAAYPVNAMGMSKGLMEKVAIARSRVAADKGCTLCVTRYGNVMASRGSVIPLFVEQIRQGLPLTVTDPDMTRFMMSLDDAVDLVVYAFQHARPGDLFVQKAPAATIGTLAEARQAGLPGRQPRSGSSAPATARSSTKRCSPARKWPAPIDLGDYFRVPADVRDLNYAKYFSDGQSQLAEVEDYHSHNVPRLSVDEMVEVLLKLPYVREELATWPHAGPAGGA